MGGSAWNNNKIGRSCWSCWSGLRLLWNRAGYPGPTGRPWPGWYPQARRSTPFFKPAPRNTPTWAAEASASPCKSQTPSRGPPYGGCVDLFLLDQEADLAGLKQLALAARQLREPLGNTMIAADRLFPELELTEAPGLQEQMARMNQGLFQLLRIINNMADAEQYLAGALPNRETTALGGFFGEILEKAAALGEKAGVQLIYTPPVREGMGNIDRQKVERAVYNLLSNALRFTPKGGLIRVSLTLERERAVLRVQDNGDGLHRQIQRDLFNRYRRSPAVEDGRFGLGLGLLLVRQTAALHGGCLLISEVPEGGTVAALFLQRNLPASSDLCSPLTAVDYAGCRDHGLVELSRELPAQLYEVRNIN